jgi:hypothetical protein
MRNVIFTSLGYKATLIFELGKREIMVEIDSGSEEQKPMMKLLFGRQIPCAERG